jgi:hypothetical protein
MTQIARVDMAGRWFAVLVATVTLAACGGGDGSSSASASSQSAPVTSSSSSSPPVTSSSPAPSAAPAPTVGAATLSWTAPDQNTDGSALTNLAGYRIYYGTSANDLDQVISISNVGITAYVVDDLTAGTYYFSIRAYTSAGTESSLSNVVSDTIS